MSRITWWARSVRANRAVVAIAATGNVVATAAVGTS